MLHRHWNLYDAFQYSSYIAPRMQVRPRMPTAQRPPPPGGPAAIHPPSPPCAAPPQVAAANPWAWTASSPCALRPLRVRRLCPSQTWREGGLSRMQLLFVNMGISLEQARMTFCERPRPRLAPPAQLAARAWASAAPGGRLPRPRLPGAATPQHSSLCGTPLRSATCRFSSCDAVSLPTQPPHLPSHDA